MHASWTKVQHINRLAGKANGRTAARQALIETMRAARGPNGEALRVFHHFIAVAGDR
jgi:hypothetical protein